MPSPNLFRRKMRLRLRELNSFRSTLRGSRWIPISGPPPGDGPPLPGA